MTALAAVGTLVPAQASADHIYDSHWGSSGIGNGQFSGPSGITLATGAGGKSGPATAKFTVTR